jgi:hypothetical protein
VDFRAERIGKNEALFREVNERVRDITRGFGAYLPDAEFVCECGDENCADRVRVALPEYEAVRKSPTYFLVKPGHEISDVETVLEEHDTYIVVAKHTAAADVAVKTDPRR